MGKGSRRGSGSGRRRRVNKGRRRDARIPLTLAKLRRSKRDIVVASLVLGGCLAVFIANRSTGGAVAAAATNVFRDPLGMLDARSPGEREAGALTQTKERKLAGLRSDGPGPHERVLSVVRDRLPAIGLPILPDGLPNPFASPLALNTPVPENLVPLSNLTPSAFSGAPNAPTAAPFNRGVLRPESTDSLLPPSDEDTSPGSIGSVPEPATWAMLIVGFLAIAFTMRRGRRAAFDMLPGADL